MESIKIDINTYYIDKELKPGSQKKFFFAMTQTMKK